jgi:hypothetical protein
VRGQDEVKLFLGYGVHPAADSTSARKCDSVFAVAVDNGEFHIAFERSGIYWLPVHNEFIHHPVIYDRFRERRWSFEMLRHYRHSNSVLNLTVSSFRSAFNE